MKLQSGDRLDNLVSFISELKSNLKNDQIADNNVSDTKNLFWNTTIAELKAEIIVLQDEIDSLLIQVSELTLQLKSLQKEILILNEELALLDQKQTRLEEARKSDIVAFNTRVAQQNSMLLALTVIITNLTQIVESGSFIETSQVKLAIEKLPENRLLTQLLTLSSSFTPATVNAIIQKLKEIKASLKASIEEDEAYELTAQANYITLIEEFENSRYNVQESLKTIQVQIESIEDKIEAANAQIQVNRELVQNKQELIVEYETQQAEFNALYQRRLVAR